MASNTAATGHMKRVKTVSVPELRNAVNTQFQRDLKDLVPKHVTHL